MSESMALGAKLLLTSNLRRIPPPDGIGAGAAERALAAAVDTFNDNVDKLNDLLFTHLDYAAIGERVQARSGALAATGASAQNGSVHRIGRRREQKCRVQR